MDDHDYDEISEEYIDWILAQGQDLQRPFTVVDADALDDWDAWDEDAEVWQPCPHCNGTGRKVESLLECDHCNGEGYVWE